MDTPVHLALALALTTTLLPAGTVITLFVLLGGYGNMSPFILYGFIQLVDRHMRGSGVLVRRQAHCLSCVVTGVRVRVRATCNFCESI